MQCAGAPLEAPFPPRFWYKNNETGIAESIPRHREIKEQLAKKIIKRLS